MGDTVSAAGLLFSWVLVAIPLAFVQVGREYGVPPEVIYAVAMTESRSVFQTSTSTSTSMPWPWTLNVAGTPMRFESRESAHAAVMAHLAKGETRIDVGLMQIHWAVHSAQLGSSWRALDPWFNLRYGASVLRNCFLRHGEWVAAAGCYHAPNRPTIAARYQSRFMEQIAIVKLAGGGT